MTTPPTRHLSDEQAPRKALYLMGDTPRHIHSDGPRLLVKTTDGPTLRLPYQRISRIISGPCTHWHGQAITACLGRHIPIIWLDRYQHPVGDAHPLHGNESPLHQVIEHYLDLPDWQDRYTNWLKHRRMDLLNRVQRHHNIPANLYNALKREYVYLQRLQSPHGPQLRAAIQAVVNQRLAQARSRARYWGYDGHLLELALDLAELIWAEYSLFNPKPVHPTKLAIEQFEQWWHLRQISLETHLADLKHHLHTEIDTWP